MTLITNNLNSIENNNYFMCDGIDPDSNIQNRICVDSLYYEEGSSNLDPVYIWLISTAEVCPVTLIKWKTV